jgi:predicted transcriptional regulator
MNASINYGDKAIILAVIAFLVMMLVDGWTTTTTVTFEASLTTLRSSSMKKTTARFLRQPYREKFGIVNDILRTVLESPTIERRHKSTIGRATAIAHWVTVKYLNVLIEQDLLRISHGNEPDRHYEMTPKGIRYLQVFAKIEDDLQPV